MSDELTQAQAGQLVEKSMQGPLWGWALPVMQMVLVNIHGGVMCEWIYRPDIARWVCQHGFDVLNIHVQAQSGGGRN